MMVAQLYGVIYQGPLSGGSCLVVGNGRVWRIQGCYGKPPPCGWYLVLTAKAQVTRCCSFFRA